MSRMKGKVAVVTGSSRGIGLAIAERFIAEGAVVYLTGRRQAELDAALAKLGDQARAVQGDAGNLEDLDRLYRAVRADQGRLDVLVANAGATGAALLADASPEHFDEVFGFNTRSVFFTVQKALPLLSDGGSVVVIASATQHKGLPALAAYSASKAAVRSFARTWAAELKERGIRVNCLSPGAVDTPFLVGGDAVSKEEGDKLRALYSGWIPLGRIARTEEIAAAAAYLASSESSYSTGSELVVDGGFTQL